MSLENVDDVYPLTPMQKGMLFHSISEPGTGVFVEQIVCSLAGNLNIDRFKKAWDTVATRHPVLRTAFLWDGLDEPLQVVRSSVETNWIHADWSQSSNPERQERLEELLNSDRLTDFDLSQAPLVRMTLIHESDNNWKWIWTFHHLVGDGWSTQLLLQEIRSEYDGTSADHCLHDGPQLAYHNYVEWLVQQDQRSAEIYWRNTLAGFDTKTQLNIFDKQTPISIGHSQQVRNLPETLTTSIREFARQHRLTLNTVIQGAWSVLLSRYSRTDDVVFGVTVSGRPAELNGIEHATGLFINTLPTRIKTDGDLPIVEWLAELQTAQRELRQFEFSSLASVQKWSDLPPGESLFETIVVFENYPEPDASDSKSDFEITDIAFHEQSNYPLALLVVPGKGMQLIAVHDTQRFSDTATAQLLVHIEQILSQFVDSPFALPKTLPLVSPEEREHFVNGCNHPANRIHQDCLHHLFENHARQTPNAPAVVFQSESVSYAEIDRQANVLANRLISKGIQPNDRIGLLTERSVEMVVGIIGILKSGAAYIPFDTHWPAQHLAVVMNDANVDIVVTHGELPDSLAKTNAQTVGITTDSDSGANSGANSRVNENSTSNAPTTNVGAADLAYLIYTSGSSGRPKGVAVTHSNIVHSTKARDEFYPNAPQRFLLVSSASFDSSMVGLFWTLSQGGTVVLPKPDGERDLHHLCDLIARHKVTHTLCLPSLYDLLLDELRLENHASDESLPDSASGSFSNTLKVVIVAGETCPSHLYQKHAQTLPNSALYNEYGPTEATVWTTAHQVTNNDSGSQVPIGKPVSSVRIYLLDQHRQLVPTGVIGEIYVGGVGVAQGYLNRPQVSAERFVEDPFLPGSRMYRTSDLAYDRGDGTLMFMGRSDQQIKIRGHRIEPGEIEHVIKTHPAIEDVAVVGKTDDSLTTKSPAIQSKNLVERLAALPNNGAETMIRKIEGMSDAAIDQLLAEIKV